MRLLGLPRTSSLNYDIIPVILTRRIQFTPVRRAGICRCRPLRKQVRSSWASGRLRSISPDGTPVDYSDYTVSSFGSRSFDFPLGGYGDHPATTSGERTAVHYRQIRL